jgi:hypothetical protein
MGEYVWQRMEIEKCAVDESGESGSRLEQFGAFLNNPI